MLSALVAVSAHGFCGHYVGGVSDELYNRILEASDVPEDDLMLRLREYTEPRQVGFSCDSSWGSAEAKKGSGCGATGGPGWLAIGVIALAAGRRRRGPAASR